MTVKSPQSAARAPSRSGGYLVLIVAVLGLGIFATYVFGRSYSSVALQKEPFQRLSYVPSFDPIEDVSLGVSANASNAVASAPDPKIRVIEIFPTQTVLVAGGKAVKSIDASAPASLHELVALVDNPDWISESGSVITLTAAVLAENGSALAVAAPATTELVMTVRQGVFLGATNATLTLSGVYVHASDAKVPKAFSTPDEVAGRPFILAVASTMHVTNSVFRYLGRDWNSSYGLSWSKGSTGSVTGSLFEHNFIGVYSNASGALVVSHDRFYYNSLYGVDPPSGSTPVTVEFTTSNYNGRHGIIFSDHVSGGIVRNNTTIGNGLNGIMMDDTSNNNTITNNLVTDNQSDGIVMASSAGNVISTNTIRNNRIGITLRGDTAHAVITQNVITDNKMAGQGANLAGNELAGNGGEWVALRIGIIWAATFALMLVALAAAWTGARRRRKSGGHRRRPPRVGKAPINRPAAAT